MGNKIRLEKIFAILMTAFLLISNVGCKSNERKVENNVYIKDINVGGKSKAEVEQIVKEISKNIDVEPKDASLNEENLEIIPEVLGKKVNIDSTLKAVLNAKEGERVEP